MKPRKTPESNTCYTLAGGNEDNYLWVEKSEDGDSPYIVSEWELTPAEREVIAVGGRIQLVMHSHVVPPVSMLAVLRGSDGSLTIVEPQDQTKGSAVLLPVQAQRLRRWLRGQKAILQNLLESTKDQAEINQIKGTMAETDDLLIELRPIGYAAVKVDKVDDED